MAEVVEADMEDVDSLRRAFEGPHGVFSVQNGLVSGFDREVIQSRNVADVASQVGVAPLGHPGLSPWPLRAWPTVPTRFMLCTEDRFFT